MKKKKQQNIKVTMSSGPLERSLVVQMGLYKIYKTDTVEFARSSRCLHGFPAGARVSPTIKSMSVRLS